MCSSDLVTGFPQEIREGWRKVSSEGSPVTVSAEDAMTVFLAKLYVVVVYVTVQLLVALAVT